MTFVKPQNTNEDSIRLTLLYNDRKNPYLAGLNKLIQFDERNPKREFTSICNYAAPGTPMSLTYLRNTTNIKFVKILMVFFLLFRLI